jgi:transposase-like protein
MPSYSQEFKEQIVRKLLPPHSHTISALSRETGISMRSLQIWRKHFQTQGAFMPSKSKAKPWDAKSKLAFLMQTALMNEAERNAWCREQGLYPEQLDEWQRHFESMDTRPSADIQATLVKERKKIRSLEKELHRKEKALAEAAALLTLSKKAQAIWGTNEDD